MGDIFAKLTENPLAAAIAICELGFWVVLAAGLVARYPLRMPRTGAVLLVSTPLLDLALLVVTVVDLRRGGEASGVHGLGAAYLGFSVAFGHSLIRWADQWFAYRFAGGPVPVKPPKHGPVRLRHEWVQWGRCVLACVVACAVMALLSFVVGTPERTEALWAFPAGWMPRLGFVAGVWLVAGPLWELLSTPPVRTIRRNATDTSGSGEAG